MLRFTNLQKGAKVLLQRPQYGMSFVEPNKLVYSYERNTENNDKYTKIKYKVPYQPYVKERIEREKFNRLKKDIQEKMRREMAGESTSKNAAKDADVVFKRHEQPEPRRYDRVLAKEMYFNPRINNLFDYNNRKIQYLTEFQGPFEIHDERITSLLESAKKILDSTLNNQHIMNFQDPEFNPNEVFLSSPELVSILDNLRELIPKTNHRLYPNIALYLSFNLRYKEDFAKIWEAMEKELFKVLHNMSTIELAKLKYAVGGVFPKAGTPKLHRALLDLTLEDLPNCSPSELLHVFHAFRLLPNYKLYPKVVEQIYKKAQLFAQAQPDTLADLFYTYANCRLKKHQRATIRDPIEELREANDLLDHFLPHLETAIPQMSSDALVRLSLAMMLMRTSIYGDIIVKIERAVKRRAGELDAFQTANIIYAFSKMNDGAGAGKNGLFTELEKSVLKNKDKFNDLEISRIFYAYSARALLSKELQDKFILPWVNEKMDTFNYSELANVAYGLMFIESTDKELWRRFTRNVCLQKNRVPLSLYLPFKLARYYMDIYFDHWDFSHYEDCCFEADRNFNTARLEKQAELQEYSAVTKALRGDLKDQDIKFWIEWENLFVVDYAKVMNKFGILVRKERDSIPGKREPRPLFKLKKKILEDNGWKILDLDYQSFVDMGPEVRVEWLKKEVERYTKETEEMRAYVEEERRDKVFDTLDAIEGHMDRKYENRSSQPMVDH